MAESEFDRLQQEYLKRLRRQLRGAPAALQEDAIREVQAHIDDACRETPDDAGTLQAVLERLGPPEQYGRELGLQLMLQANRAHPSVKLWVWIAVFWATTSIVGMFVVVGAAIVYLFGLAFLMDGIIRLVDPTFTTTLIQINEFSIKLAWNPLVNILIGILILYLLTLALIRLIQRWGLGKLNQRGLAATLNRDQIVLPKNWERRASWTILVIATLGFLGCSIFGVLGQLFPVGHTGRMSLPEDFFKNPLTFLAFLGGLAFLLSPVLGIVWTAWREQRKDRLNSGGPAEQ